MKLTSGFFNFQQQRSPDGVAFWSGVHEIVSGDSENISIAMDITEALAKIDATGYKDISVGEIADKFNVDPSKLIIV